MTQTQRKALPDRESLRARAVALLEQPDGYIVSGPSLEGMDYNAPELRTLLENEYNVHVKTPPER